MNRSMCWPMPPKKASVGGTGTSARSTSCSDLREPDSRAARVLREAGLELTALRAQIAKLTSNVSEEAKVGEQDLHRKAGRRRGQQLERLSYPRRSLAAGPCSCRRISCFRDAFQAGSDGRRRQGASYGRIRLKPDGQALPQHRIYFNDAFTLPASSSPFASTCFASSVRGCASRTTRRPFTITSRTSDPFSAYTICE